METGFYDERALRQFFFYPPQRTTVGIPISGS
jgi:hypothetical protein